MVVLSHSQNRLCNALADPDLALIVARWPTLPDATKAAILAMVRAVANTASYKTEASAWM